MVRIHVVYFDPDGTGHRKEVLRCAGYAVDECRSVPELADCLRAEVGADLVCIADAWNSPAEGALALARGLSMAPIVLFRSSDHNYIQHDWDLEIPPLTHPSDWLAKVEGLLAGARVGSRRPVMPSRPLHVEATAAHAQSAGVRGRMRREP